VCRIVIVYGKSHTGIGYQVSGAGAWVISRQASGAHIRTAPGRKINGVDRWALSVGLR
jgi:hypothetical protein